VRLCCAGDSGIACVPAAVEIVFVCFLHVNMVLIDAFRLRCAECFAPV
jgi:hypothetical protein